LGENPTVQSVASIDLESGARRDLSSKGGFSAALAVGSLGGTAIESEALGVPRSVRVFSGYDERMIPSRAEAPGLEVTTRLLELKGVQRSYFAAVTLPKERSPGQTFPGLFYVYGGPMASTVDHRGSRMVLDQWLANCGFVVFRFDVRGTPRRGRDWERALDGDLYAVQLEDQVEAVPLLAAEVPELDASRVGVYGWSFGGYATAMAVMRAPDTFHAGVAGAPVIDWADYDTHYTERYLGVPANVLEDPAYLASDVTRYAKLLRRPLMVLHGTADDNVFFTHALKLSDALTRLGKPHALAPLSR
ncbi:MAG: prolyl oligopeptidase family serine peptidase, partial [Myxococcota bacterium]